MSAIPSRQALAAVARESRERRCLVVGEDLGTVPEGFREPMNEAGILSCKVLWFERWADGLFKAPDAYDARALATISTHDLSTVRGFFSDADLAWRERLGLYPSAAQAAGERQRRATAIQQLRDALRYAGLPADPADPEALTEALHRYLARTPSWLVGAQIEDLLGEQEQPNLPGTIDEHPNWRRRMPVRAEDLARPPAGRAALRRSARGASPCLTPARAPPTACSSAQGVGFAEAAGAGALSGPPGRQPSLRLADLPGAHGLDPRLRPRRSQRARPGAGRP